MKPSLFAVLVLALLIPLGSTVWMGSEAMERDRDNVERRVREALMTTVEVLDQGVGATVASLARELDLLAGPLTEARSMATSGTAAPSRIPEGAGRYDLFTELSASHPLIVQAYLVEEGLVRYPEAGNETVAETEGRLRLKARLDRGPLAPQGPEGHDTSGGPQAGWTLLHQDPGYWYRWIQSGESTVVLELNSSAFLARIMQDLPASLAWEGPDPGIGHDQPPAQSPDNSPAPTSGHSINQTRLQSRATGEASDQASLHRLAILDQDRGILAQWGDFEPGYDDQSLIELPLPTPLQSFTWTYHLHPAAWDDLGKLRVDFFLYPSLILALVLAALALWLRNEMGRELRVAAQKVSFVNQVSHELKTPLTNIQLYTDLARTRIDNSDPVLAPWLDIIDAETQRLGRMIHNVLSFSRKGRTDPPLLQGTDLGTLVAMVGTSFAPSFKARSLELVLTGPAGLVMRTDPDWLGQILYNLLSNGEKYGAAGGRIEVTWFMGQAGTKGSSPPPAHTAAASSSKPPPAAVPAAPASHAASPSSTSPALHAPPAAPPVPGTIIFLRVQDWGPGIPWKDREKIFQPFVRLSDRVTDGTAGAGLGLGIARDLARRLGGNLVLEHTDTGASFLLTLPCKPGGVP